MGHVEWPRQKWKPVLNVKVTSGSAAAQVPSNGDVSMSGNGEQEKKRLDHPGPLVNGKAN